MRSRLPPLPSVQNVAGELATGALAVCDCATPFVFAEREPVPRVVRFATGDPYFASDGRTPLDVAAGVVVTAVVVTVFTAGVVLVPAGVVATVVVVTAAVVVVTAAVLVIEP